jgi:hypothetical protein
MARGPYFQSGSAASFSAIRSWKLSRRNAASMSVTTRLTGYGIWFSMSARAASVARHSAASLPAIRRALAVRVIFLVRASAPVVVRTRPAARMAATFWLVAECVRCTEEASSVMVIGPRACSRSSSITMLGVSPVICVFGLPIALFPAINAERYGGDPRTLGLFTTAIGVGGLVTAALSGPVGRIVRQGRAMLWAVAVWGAAFAGFAVISTLWLTLVMLAIAGAADTFTVVFRGTIVQQTTPDEFRGRVTAADYVMGVSGGQLGNLEAGALGSLTSPAISALAGGLITVAGAAVIGLALPAFARYQRQPPAAVTHPGRRQRAEETAEQGADRRGVPVKPG